MIKVGCTCDYKKGMKFKITNYGNLIITCLGCGDTRRYKDVNVGVGE